MFRSIDPVCIETTPEDDTPWVCPEELEVDCTEIPEFVHVVVDEGECDKVSLASIAGPFTPGEHDIVIIDEKHDEVVCETSLKVVDTHPPEVITQHLKMWPSNHKMHAFALSDCFEDVLDCDPDWEARLVWIASDEPENANGDGNTAPDIELHDATHFALRAERQGAGNGRVYTIGWEILDSSNNQTEGVCHVDVPHDRSGRPAEDDGEAYRVELED
jgi:hypothetical protein